MDIKIIDKILFPFWDRIFEGSTLEGKKYSDMKWIGFWKDNILILGVPFDNKNNQWYCNGEIFANKWNYFNLSPEDFYDSMKRFVNKKYELGISDII